MQAQDAQINFQMLNCKTLYVIFPQQHLTGCLLAGAYVWAGCTCCCHCDEDCEEHSAHRKDGCLHNPSALY